ncbi:hypothetical protein L484_015893 [Morus notabilis]|uniref:Uncharacterized protein n=1 Tax=Morus notabilis TaxID=981085 RepID=W9RB97_9ROSA|nr:hypothetical protein L484_015893 [Morus notabilis]
MFALIVDRFWWNREGNLNIALTTVTFARLAPPPIEISCSPRREDSSLEIQALKINFVFPSLTRSKICTNCHLFFG